MLSSTPVHAQQSHACITMERENVGAAMGTSRQPNVMQACERVHYTTCPAIRMMTPDAGLPLLCSQTLASRQPTSSQTVPDSHQSGAASWATCRQLFRRSALPCRWWRCRGRRWCCQVRGSVGQGWRKVQGPAQWQGQQEQISNLHISRSCRCWGHCWCCQVGGSVGQGWTTGAGVNAAAGTAKAHGGLSNSIIPPLAVHSG